VLATVLQCLPRWTPFGGLRHLDLKINFNAIVSPTAPRQPWATRYVSALTKYCPNLETVNDCKQPRRGRSVEHWYVPMETWEQFCASCTQLTSFNWSLVAFATTYFEAFGRYPKPRLAKLTLSTHKDWNWHSFSRRQLKRMAGYGPTARNPQAALPGCPALRELCVTASSEGR
jgi:hypothetical protein